MKLLNNLYSIDTVSQSDEGIICTIRLIAESPIYSAHFPMQPITPGACIVQMAVELYEESMVEGQLGVAEVKGQRSKVNGQWTMVNGPLGPTGRFYKAKRLKEWSMVNGQLSIVKVKTAKFLHAITPSTDGVFTYLISPKPADQGLVKLQVVVISDDVTYAKLSLVCKEI